ncbi:hypothetical protein D1007_15050 [Hordeum vulgare]|uniref:KIB1-4 beta-propeller domain-containing protein n=1 Tax=Hordeum vulgare subsp. vulgare TaxID=112509 RepID=A0A8I7B2M3_HORVV|nr:uncharacterized protein LOC123407626 [Hordeum vulgare subsp. vulgare]KAE8808495.1 hypothetical protein D1007_15050 [Hordeum vulgare]
MAPSSSPPALKVRSWADLEAGPAGLIAECVLAYDVADYISFRAVCRPWRQCSPAPRAYDSLDRRIHPRRWIMLREPLSAPSRRSDRRLYPRERIRLATPDCRRHFLSTSTGKCIHIEIPELRGHDVLALTAEGLLVLLDRPQRTAVRLFNPLTRHLTELPPLTTLLSQEQRDCLLSSLDVSAHFGTWGSGILNLNDDDSTVVLCFNSLSMLGMAKKGDVCWTPLNIFSPIQMAPLIFLGRFYCVTIQAVMVLEDQPPRLEVAARLPNRFQNKGDSVHLVDNDGDLMLVHRSRTVSRYARYGYDAYQVDLDARTVCRVNSLGGGGHALFIGMYCSLSVTSDAFPAGSFSSDTIYLSFDIGERVQTEGFLLADRSIIPTSSYIQNHLSVPQPQTLVDCLSLCSTGQI